MENILKGEIMFRHKILWLTLITGFLLFSGCSSSSDGDKTNNPETNTTEECNLTTHELFGDQCLEKCEADQERDEDGTCVIVDTNTTPECDLTTHEIVNEQCLEKCAVGEERGENGVCETRTVAKILKSLYLQGVAIDGYLQDSNGILKCGEKETSFVTAKNGFYEAKFEDLDENATLETCIVEVYGGIDASTGKPFEGTISNIAEENSFGVSIYEEETIKPTPTLKEPVIITPLTTFVTNAVVEASKKGETISKAEAEEQVSQSLGITTKALKSNPVAVLDDNTSTDEEKEEVAKAVKQTFIIQKLTESLSKSTLTDTADTTEKEIQFKQAYSAVISAVSKKMENNSSLDLNKVLEEDGDRFAEEVALKMNEESLQSATEENKKAKIEAFAKMLVQLKAATRATSKAVSIISKMDTKDLAKKSDSSASKLEVASKSIQIITDALETQMSEIAKADVEIDENLVTQLSDKLLKDDGSVNLDRNITSPSLDVAVAKAEKTANAIIAMGGLTEVSKTVEKVVEKANDAKADISLNEDEEVADRDYLNDIDILDEDTINDFSNLYDQYVEAGINEKDILDVSSAVSSGMDLETAVATKVTTEVNLTTLQTAVTTATTILTTKTTAIVNDINTTPVVVKKVVPLINLLAPKVTGFVGDALSFSVAVTNSANITTAIAYQWKIGTASAGNNAPTLTNTFNEAGTFVVTVTVTANGQQVSKDVTVTISEKEVICETGTHLDTLTNTCIPDVVSVAPVLTLTSNLYTAYTGTAITFTAGSDIAGTTYSWTVGSATQSSTSSTLSYTFTTAGTYIVSVTGTANGLSTTKTTNVTIYSSYVAPSDTSDSLTLKSNQVTFGADSFAKTVTSVNGDFGTVKYEPLTSVSDDNKSDVFVISFDVENANFEGGEEENVTIVMHIANDKDTSNQQLLAMVPNITLKYSGGLFTLDTTNATTLYGYGVKESGVTVSTEITDINFSKYLTLSSNKLTLSYYDVMEMITDKVAWGENIIDSYFQKGGDYEVNLAISGIDGFNGMTTVSNDEVTSDFSSDQKTLIENKLFSGKTFAVGGLISIAQIGEIDNFQAKVSSESNETQTYDVSNYFSSTNGTSSYSLECDPTDGGITIDNNGVITVNTDNGGNYECNVTFDANGVSEVSDNFTIYVVDNGKPTFSSTIPNQNFIVDVAISDIDITSHFSDPENDVLTYSISCSVAGLSIDPTTGIISGTPTETTTGTTCSILATDIYNQSVSSDNFTIVVSTLPAPTVDSLIVDPTLAEGNTSDEFTFTASGSVESATGGDTDVTYKWFVSGTEQNGETSDTFVHTFSQSITGNKYTVKVEVSANSQTASKEINVTINNNAPEVSFTTAPTTCEVNSTCSFVATASDKDSGDTLSYDWEINGTEQENDNTLTFDHTFTEAGTYTVTFMAYDNGGSEKSIDVNVTVSEPVPNLYNIVESHDLSSDWNGYKLASSLTGSFSSTLLSLGSSNSSVSTDPVQGTDTTTIYLVETAGDQDNFIEFKFDNSSYSTGDIIYIKLGTKTTTITVGNVSNEDEIVLQ
jgi:hypothetical protein